MEAASRWAHRSVPRHRAPPATSFHSPIRGHLQAGIDHGCASSQGSAGDALCVLWSNRMSCPWRNAGRWPCPIWS